MRVSSPTRLSGSTHSTCHKSDAELAALFQPVLREHGVEVSDELAGTAGIMKRACVVHHRPVGPDVVFLRRTARV